MKLPFQKIVNDEKETRTVCKEFAKSLESVEVIALNGNLGAGKTFFVQKVCESFNISFANSPTFAIVNEYVGDRKVLHFDFYRIKKVNELYDIGIEEYFSDSEAITFIEWANMFEEVLPKNRINVEIDYIDETKRKIKISRNEN